MEDKFQGSGGNCSGTDSDAVRLGNRGVRPAGTDDVEQRKEHVDRVENLVSALPSQDQLCNYLCRRCAELTLREGYNYFRL